MLDKIRLYWFLTSGKALLRRYSENPLFSKLLDVTQVTVLPHFSFLLKFENGERCVFKMNDYFDQMPWARLKADYVFQGIFVENGTVAWAGNIDIDPETLCELSVPFDLAQD